MKRILSVCIVIILSLSIFSACGKKNEDYNFSPEELKYDLIDTSQYDMLTINFFNAQGASIGTHNFSSANYLQNVNSMQPEEHDNVFLISSNSSMPNLNISGNMQIVSSFEINEKEKYARIKSDSYIKSSVDLQIKTTYAIQSTVSSFFSLPSPESAVKNAVYRVTNTQTQNISYYDGWQCVYKNGDYIWEPISYATSIQVDWQSTIANESALPEPNESNVGFKYRKTGSRNEYETRLNGFYKIKEENSIRDWERDEELSIELSDYISSSQYYSYIFKVKYKTEWLKKTTSTTILKYDHYSLIKTERQK